jgi:hypothetical protein
LFFFLTCQWILIRLCNEFYYYRIKYIDCNVAIFKGMIYIKISIGTEQKTLRSSLLCDVFYSLVSIYYLLPRPTIYLPFLFDTQMTKKKKLALVLIYEHNFKLNLMYLHLWTNIYLLKLSQISKNCCAGT